MNGLKFLTSVSPGLGNPSEQLTALCRTVYLAQEVLSPRPWLYNILKRYPSSHQAIKFLLLHKEGI